MYVNFVVQFYHWYSLVFPFVLVFAANEYKTKNNTQIVARAKTERQHEHLFSLDIYLTVTNY